MAVIVGSHILQDIWCFYSVIINLVYIGCTTILFTHMCVCACVCVCVRACVCVRVCVKSNVSICATKLTLIITEYLICTYNIYVYTFIMPRLHHGFMSTDGYVCQCLKLKFQREIEFDNHADV